MKITVLFGSFNPLTNAHISMLKTAVDALNADKGLFVATNGQYLKRKSDYSPILLVNRAQRYEYCIRHNAPKTVVDEEGRCLAGEMIVYNYCIKETN